MGRTLQKVCATIALGIILCSIAVVVHLASASPEFELFVSVPRAKAESRVLWLPVSSMLESRVRLAATGNSSYMFALGGEGQAGKSLSSVERVVVNADGSLGDWQATSPMNQHRAGHGAVISNTQIYALGGITMNGGSFGTVLTSVERSTIGVDGSLGTWQLAPPLNKPRFTPGAVVVGNHIYVIGGWPIGQQLASVEVSEIQPDGLLGPWQYTSAMNTPRSMFDAVAVDGYIYAIGGNYGWTGKECLKSVERAKVNADGSLGAWEYVSSMKKGRELHKAVAIGGYLYAIGGWTCTGGTSDTIERARVNADGTLGSWEIVLTMSQPRVCHAAEGFPYSDHIYVVGGSEDYSPSKSVEAIPINAPLTYGMTINDGALFTNQISVTLTISAPYTTVEMQVSNDGGFAEAQWEPYAPTEAWTITQYGSYVIPRVVYIRFKDVNGIISSALQDDIILDVTAPTGSVDAIPPATSMNRELTVPGVEIAGGDSMTHTVLIPMVLRNFACPATGPSNIGLQLFAEDDVSGVADMMISNDKDLTCASWEPYATDKEWYAPAGTSTTVYVQFRDNAGNVSEVVTDTVTMP